MKEPRLQKTALAITRWIGSPQSIAIHTLIFAAFIVLLLLKVFAFDALLLVFNTMVSLEAIYLALFIQMTVNYQAESILEVEQDIDEMQEDVSEIQEDIDELQEDVEDISEDTAEDEARDVAEAKHLDEIHAGLRRLIADVEQLQKAKNN